MNDYPDFMKNPADRIATSNQATPGVEGYVFDGADGGQMAFWTCSQTASSAAHVHDFDEWMLVVQGCYTLIIDGDRIPITAGMEYFIPRGTLHAGEVVAGTRTIHAFGGHRADRHIPKTKTAHESGKGTERL
jgi:quercetin dioxygenase-like cupin family protein